MKLVESLFKPINLSDFSRIKFKIKPPEGHYWFILTNKKLSGIISGNCLFLSLWPSGYRGLVTSILVKSINYSVRYG